MTTMVQDDPKVLDDGGEIPKSQGRGQEVGGAIPGCEISSLLDKKFARWLTASCALALACWPFVSQKKRRKNNEETKKIMTTKFLWKNEIMQQAMK